MDEEEADQAVLIEQLQIQLRILKEQRRDLSN